ncbi:MAG: type I-C CRISPR-associated endonuclease Cas1 [Clostridia bacterium]|nr:type I-C CRISPR-associated endonuclease Cas1 [Clostridia bacterium]
MKRMLETLYILTPESYLYLRNDNIVVVLGGEEKASVPAVQVSSIVFFGKNTMSTALLGFCGKHDITVSFLDQWGYFSGRLCGPVSGNILLRRKQILSTEDEAFRVRFIRDLLLCKLRNCRYVLSRHSRGSDEPEMETKLRSAEEHLAEIAAKMAECSDTEALRGLEGAAGSVYFGAFDCMLNSPGGFRFVERSRRPPRNEVNAVLSFLYTQLAHDEVSALETVGLDPAAGYLHTLRPGRASFALDLMEELRAPLCDRLVLTLFNRGQLSEKDFENEATAVYLNDRGRRTVLGAWRDRKKEELRHPFLDEKIPIGMIPYTQAMLFARLLRGDLDRYPPFVWR